MKGMHCRIWGGSLPLVIPGERWSLSLCRRLLSSREPCLAGWGCWPSNIFTMSIRSILFRAVYKLSTAGKTHDGETQAEMEKKKQGDSQDKQQWSYNSDFDWIKEAETQCILRDEIHNLLMYSLLALLPSRVAHKLSNAELCSSREFGFSTRILLMSSTLSWSSRANSVKKMRE